MRISALRRRRPGDHLDQPLKVFQFDLHRVGTFVASLSGAGFGGTMQLLDPDGVVVGSSTLGGGLRCPITLRMLAKSRTAVGAVRQWSLQVEVAAPHLSITHPTVTATVLGEGRIATATLRDRLQWFLGPYGSNVQIAGANTPGLMTVMLTINAPAAAETLDMLGLLDSLLGHALQAIGPTLAGSRAVPVRSLPATFGDSNAQHEIRQRVHGSVHVRLQDVVRTRELPVSCTIESCGTN